MNLDDIDPTFGDDLEASKPSLISVAQWLHGFGYSVMWPPTRKRPDPSQIAAYSDRGDLFILQSLEVKHRNLDFTSRETFPFETVIVDSVHVYDARKPKPLFHIICNKDLTGALVVNARTRPHWRSGPNFNRGRTRIVYECPVNVTTYCELPRTNSTSTSCAS